MNDMLKQIDDDVLDEVSGGLTFSLGGVLSALAAPVVDAANVVLNTQFIFDVGIKLPQ